MIFVIEVPGHKSDPAVVSASQPDLSSLFCQCLASPHRVSASMVQLPAREVLFMTSGGSGWSLKSQPHVCDGGVYVGIWAHVQVSLDAEPLQGSQMGT